jgi:hypothetical protein
MNFFDKLSYGLYWFHVCLKEWYDAVIIGYYDEDEQPSWDFFCHINCNYPLTYRMTMGESKMTDATIAFTKEQIETLCLVCSFYRSAMDKHSFAESNIDKVKKLQVFLIEERRKFEGN